MSNHLLPLTPSAGHTRKRPYPQDRYTATWSSRYETPSSSSPRLRSSSPTSTPFTSRHAYGYAYIRSSPEISADAGFRGVSEYLEDPSSSWDHRYSSNATLKYSATYTYARRTSFSTTSDYPPPSEFDASELSEEVDHDVPDADSEHTSGSAPGQSSSVFSDSEGEEADAQDDEDGDTFGFGSDCYRSTFFRTSAERGQWKNDPIPFKPKPIPAALLQTRKSAPMLSRVPTPTLVNSTRTISEPAPSTTAQKAGCVPGDEQDLPDRATEGASSESNSITIKSTEEDEISSPHTMPSLSSDRESSADADEHAMPSPLPPSSPPLSPMSVAVSFMSRSVSPLSMAPDSPVMRSSSPLSEVPDDCDEEDQEELISEPITVSDALHLALTREPVTASTSEQTSPAHEVKPRLASGVTCEFPISTESTSTSKDIPQSDGVKPSDAIVNSGPEASAITSNEGENNAASAASNKAIAAQDAVMASNAIAAVSSSPLPQEPTPLTKNPDAMEVDGKTSATLSLAKGNTREDVIGLDVKKKSNTLKDKKNVAESSSNPELEPSTASIAKDKQRKKEKRKKEQNAEGPVKKRRKTETFVERESSSSASGSSVKTKVDGERKVEKEDDAENEVGSDPAAHAPKQKRRKRIDGEPASSAKRTGKLQHRSKARRPSSTYHNSDEDTTPDEAPLDPETAALHATVCGMVIETMAMSRASSLPVSSLYKMVMREQPGMKAQRSEKEWIRIFDKVLHSGEAGRGSGVFGKVESSGKDDADRPLEAQWFYIPELDEDQERGTLFRSMMPRPAKRSETKKYKQYYWRPLEKISRWDPEDEL